MFIIIWKISYSKIDYILEKAVSPMDSNYPLRRPVNNFRNLVSGVLSNIVSKIEITFSLPMRNNRNGEAVA